MDDRTLYELAQRRMTRIARQLSDDQLAQECPSCPGWSNQDVIAHHIHFLTGLIDDDVPAEMFQEITDTDADERERAGKVRDDWTQAGVEARRGRTLDALFAEWDERVAAMPAIIPTVDVVVHAGDVLESVGERRGLDTVLVDDTLMAYYEMTLASRVAAEGHAVTLVSTDTGSRIGAGVGAFEVRGTGNDLLRALTGRRTRAEADATLDWGDTPRSIREAFPAYGWPER